MSWVGVRTVGMDTIQGAEEAGPKRRTASASYGQAAPSHEVPRHRLHPWTLAVLCPGLFSLPGAVAAVMEEWSVTVESGGLGHSGA